MLLYDNKLTSSVMIKRPDPQTYYLLDTMLQGTKLGLNQAMKYFRQAFMIHNETFYETFMRLGAKEISNMEIVAKLLHQEHGEDDRYLDESNDDTPVFEYIMPEEEPQEQRIPLSNTHVNNDLTAAIMENMDFEEGRITLYESLIEKCEDSGAKELFCFLKESTQRAYDVLSNMLEILTTHVELKEFGEGNTHETWDLDTSNYFDKPNPYFLTPGSQGNK